LKQKEHEIIIPSAKQLPKLNVKNLAELIFKSLDHRDENSEIILSHDDKDFVRIRLKHYRYILLRLYTLFIQKGFRSGDTILLANISGNNELPVALLFSALSSFGIRVLLPMFMESHELDSWIQVTHCRAVIYPALEILSLKHHKKEKSVINEIKQIAKNRNVPVFDQSDFHIYDLIQKSGTSTSVETDQILKNILNNTNENSEALIITTSGSTGASRLVVYEQGAFLKSCLSWQCAGFFEPDRFSGRGFTPLFTHTMGIRTFFNALWTGKPVCLINTEWFTEKPETVRYLLMRMKPEHMTGGPAAFRLLLEMMRLFPELKTNLIPHMKAMVSSGAVLNPDISSEIKSIFNIDIFNAFGTTETQQVLSSMLMPETEPDSRVSLGNPLPGVVLKLMPFAGDNNYQLHIKSPFGCKKMLSDNGCEKNSNGFFYTGDIVRYENKKLLYAGRENTDFFKDGFGVKISLRQIKDFYRILISACDHVECFALQNQPGLAALVFLSKRHKKRNGSTEHNQYDFKQLIRKINDTLFASLDPFIYRHYTIRRFTIITKMPPRTAKGNVSTNQIKKQFSALIKDLTGVFPVEKSIQTVKMNKDSSDPFSNWLNPYIGGMLHGLKMDYIYHKGQKDSLFIYSGQKETEILDLAGGYGTNLLGHNHPEITDTAVNYIQSPCIKLSNQGSIQYTAGCLAERLNFIVGQRTGKHFRVCLGSSGTEIVEMALQHACLEWREKLKKIRDHQVQSYGSRAGEMVLDAWRENQKTITSCRLHVIVSASAFHGHTSGSRSLLKKSDKRDAFSNLLPFLPVYIDDEDPEWQSTFKKETKKATVELKHVVFKKGTYHIEKRKCSTIIAALFEPVLGEGGIRPLNHEVLHYFSFKEFPLIMDEIQCGLGRTGSLPSSPDIQAHYYLFAKALGGGVEKIGALLIDSSRYQQKFGKYYSSTFANGELAAGIALKTLDIIQKDNIPQRAVDRGKQIIQKLETVRKHFPDVITGIEGRGLMQGVHFDQSMIKNNIVLRILAENKMLGYLYASYLLHKHRIRIFPSLSASNVLRIEPSAYITDDEINWLHHGFEDLAKKIQERNLYELFRHLMDDDKFTDNRGKKTENGLFYQGMDEPAKNSVKVTFICHFAYPVDELRAFENDFSRASDTGLRILANRIQLLMEMKPVTLFQKNIFGDRIHFTCMIIPLDSAELERRHREGKRKKIVSKIQNAVNIAVQNGSRIISLGGYTSILSNNGMSVTAPDHVKIITGNTLTAASGLQRVLQEIKQNPGFCKKNVLAIVGASGNIGTVLCEQLIPRTDLFSEILLLGRNKKQLSNLITTLRNSIEIPDEIILRLETNLQSLIKCDVIIISTNTNDPIIFRHHIKKSGQVLIADNSVPAALAKDVPILPNVISLPFASYVKLPEDPDFVISSYTPQGTVFCCAAEAMLCGLEKVALPLKGKISNEAVIHLTKLAKKHGFFNGLGGLGSYKSKGQT